MVNFDSEINCLWKCTNDIKQPNKIHTLPPGNGSWVRDYKQKSNIFAEYLTTAFKLNIKARVRTGKYEHLQTVQMDHLRLLISQHHFVKYLKRCKRKKGPRFRPNKRRIIK